MRRPRNQYSTTSYASWYKTKRWQSLRWSVLVEEGFTCAMCGRMMSDTSKLVADHKRPHKGDTTLFWDRSNLQCLCKHCHDTHKQVYEKSGRVSRPVGLDGYPL